MIEPDTIKKNLLDLEHNKLLQYTNTSIIILFTYYVGLIIASITKQIDYTNFMQLTIIFILTSCISVIILFLIFTFNRKLRIITNKITKLNIEFTK